MKRFALICMMVVAAAAATWAASTTEKTIPLKSWNGDVSFQALLNDLQQQGAAKSSQSAARVSWQSLLNAAGLNKTNTPEPSLAADLSNVRGGSGVPRVETLQNQIDVLEGQIDQALVRHEKTAGLYERLNALYAQRPAETDMPSFAKGDSAVTSVPVICGGDNCATATAISALPFCAMCYTTNAHDNYTPVCIAQSLSGPDVVFKYTPADSQVISVSLCGSAFNTVLSIYDECPVPGVAPLC